MTATMHEKPAAEPGAEPAPETWAARVLVPEMWAAVSIVAMWTAVLFVGIYGDTMTFRGADQSWTNVPSGVAVALFAAIGTVSVARRVFGRAGR